ncbi:hypothetical protein [Leeia sp.]|uniref:hypothetical protein n=1 Tax=Leeia sp. TaxID=2884678 RepID=UPI0035ADE845
MYTSFIYTTLQLPDFPSTVQDESTLCNADAYTPSNPAGLLTYSDSERIADAAIGCQHNLYLECALEELCKLSGIQELEGLYTPAQATWSFPSEYEECGMETWGVWYEGAALEAVLTHLRALREWSRLNMAQIETHPFLGEPLSDIATALEYADTQSCHDLNQAYYAEDGDGLGMLFAYLAVCEKIFYNAIQSRCGVLHCSAAS